MGHLDEEKKVSNVEELKFPPEYFETHNQIPFGRDLVLLILKDGIQITPKIDVIALPPKNYQPPGKYWNHRLVGREIFHALGNRRAFATGGPSVVRAAEKTNSNCHSYHATFEGSFSMFSFISLIRPKLSQILNFVS